MWFFSSGSLCSTISEWFGLTMWERQLLYIVINHNLTKRDPKYLTGIVGASKQYSAWGVCSVTWTCIQNTFRIFCFCFLENVARKQAMTVNFQCYFGSRKIIHEYGHCQCVMSSFWENRHTVIHIENALLLQLQPSWIEAPWVLEPPHPSCLKV